jgi:hypothetical protein
MRMSSFGGGDWERKESAACLIEAREVRSHFMNVISVDGFVERIFAIVSCARASLRPLM